MPKLPDLKYRELINLLIYFGCEVEGEDSPQLKARRSQGQAVIHCHPSQGMWSEALGSVLKDLGITREQFWAWRNSGSKRRAKTGAQLDQSAE